MKTGVAIASVFVSLLLLSLALTVHPAVAEEALYKVDEPPQLKVPVGKVPVGAEAPLANRLAPELLLPSRPELFSGRAWLVTSGLDPALRLGKGGGLEEPPDVRLQGVGAAGTALIPYRSPAAKFSRTILVSRDKGGLPIQCGPHLAVHPKDPDHIVVVLMDYNFPGIASYASLDGGATWEGPFQPKISREAFTGVGDPVVVFDRKGNVYTAQMSLDEISFSLDGVTGAAAIFNIEISRSEDGGLSWKQTVTAAPGWVLTQVVPPSEGGRLRGDVVVVLNDKPWIAVGPNPEDSSRDNIYLVYTRFTERWQLLWVDELPVLNLVEESTTIQLVRSEDEGLTWSRPVSVSPQAFHRGKETSQVVQGSQVVVAPDGTLHVAWFDSTGDDVWEGLGEIRVASSSDGGRTFTRPLLVATFVENPFMPRSASFRFWGTGFPQMAVGPKGEIYIAYTSPPPDNPEDDGDVFLIRSFDGGKSWARRMRVNDDKSGRLQFFPSVAVDPEGAVHMMWADTRDDPTELDYHIYYSFSKDRGETWEFNSRVSDFPSNPNLAFPQGRYIGDYFTVKATADDVYIVWADSRLGRVAGTNQKIAFARKKLMPAPSIFISPPSGPGGEEVTIQGFNFQPDLDLFIEVGGVVVATAHVQEEGRFSTQIFIPISGSGAHDVTVVDTSGNVATSSFFMDFGFGDVKKTKEQLGTLTGQVAAMEQELKSTAVDTSKTLTGEIQGLRQAVDELAAAEAEREKGMPGWLVALIAAAIAAVATATIMLLLWRFAPRGRGRTTL